MGASDELARDLEVEESPLAGVVTKEEVGGGNSADLKSLIELQGPATGTDVQYRQDRNGRRRLRLKQYRLLSLERWNSGDHPRD